MRRGLWLCTAWAVAIIVVAPVANAEHHHGHSGPVHVGTTTGGLWTGVTHQAHGDAQAFEADLNSNGPDVPIVDIGSGLFDDFCTGVNWSGVCAPGSAAPVEPQLTAGVVAAAFRRIPLPPSVLVVQPAGGRTLVNFATNFYTESGPFTRTVVLLGQRVELRIWPSRFGWVFGDGASLATSSAGSPFPDLEVTHGYRRSGWVGPRVDTTYAAQFRVGGGLWRAVPGSVTIAGVPVDLEVVTARPVLVAAR